MSNLLRDVLQFPTGSPSVLTLSKCTQHKNRHRSAIEMFGWNESFLSEIPHLRVYSKKYAYTTLFLWFCSWYVDICLKRLSTFQKKVSTNISHGLKGSFSYLQETSLTTSLFLRTMYICSLSPQKPFSHSFPWKWIYATSKSVSKIGVSSTLNCIKKILTLATWGSPTVSTFTCTAIEVRLLDCGCGIQGSVAGWNEELFLQHFYNSSRCHILF